MQRCFGVTLLVASVLGTACSSKDHPPVLDSNPRPGHVTSGGKSSVTTGDGGTGDDASVPAGGSSSGTPVVNHPVNGGPSFAFSPNHVYLNGNLDDGGDAYAVTDLFDSSVYATTSTGFSAAGGTVFRHQFYYFWAGEGIFTLGLDYVGSKRWDYNYDYPKNPRANDARVPTPRCDPDAPQAFLVSPDDKHLVYQCKDNNWYEDDVLVYDGPERYQISALSYDGLFLLGRSGQLGTMSIHDVQRHTQEKTNPRVLAVRAKKGGFLYALYGEDSRPTLWEMDAEANPTQLGVYPPPPDDVDLSTNEENVLLNDGTLFQIGTSQADGRDDVVVSRKPDADSAVVVYSEADDPLVSITANSLFSSP